MPDEVGADEAGTTLPLLWGAPEPVGNGTPEFGAVWLEMLKNNDEPGLGPILPDSVVAGMAGMLEV